MQVPVGQRVPDRTNTRNDHVRVGGGHAPSQGRRETLHCPQRDRVRRSNVTPPSRVKTPNIFTNHVQVGNAFVQNPVNFNSNTNAHSIPIRNDSHHYSPHVNVGTGVARTKSVSWINKLGYIPGLGTIIGVIRIAISTLKLSTCKSSVDRFHLHEQIKRGFIELIPFIGGGILLYKDQH